MTYGNLNLEISGPLAKELLIQVDDEAEQSDIRLTSAHNANIDNPSGCTPRMVSWYQRNIVQVRRAAIADVRAEFDKVKFGKAASGFVYELERDKLEADKFNSIRTERETFQAKREVSHLIEEFGKARTAYEKKVSEHGREAQEWEPFKYWLVLSLIGVIEAFINWESFLRIPNFTPFFATGLVLLVALAFMWSSHIVGHIIKQRRELFGGFVARTDRWSAAQELSLGLILFLLGIGAVAWGRWFFLSDVLMRRHALGESSGWTDYLGFGGSILGNLIVYFVGVVWAYWKHDAIPDFAEIRRRLQKLQARQLVIFRRLLEDRTQRHILNERRKQEELSRRDQEQRTQLRNYGQLRLNADFVFQKDAGVIALLTEYRSRLIDAQRKSERSCEFVRENLMLGNMSTEERISGDAYMGEPIRLSLAY
jgi:hypothetical protein